MLEIGNAILEFLSMYVDLSFSSNSHEFEILSYKGNTYSREWCQGNSKNKQLSNFDIGIPDSLVLHTCLIKTKNYRTYQGMFWFE